MGKLKEHFLQRGIEHYLIRLKPYSRVGIIELPKAKTGEKEQLKEKALEEEAKEVQKHIRENAHLIPLAAEGKMMSSEELASYLEKLLIEGKSNLDFVIGGPLGLAESLKKRGDLRLSLSSLTFSHRMARLILLEQLYRCFKIIRGETYHK